MYKLSVLVLISLMILSCLADQDVPLNKVPYGFSVGDQQGTTHINFFIDFLCSDSKQSYGQWLKLRRSIDLHQHKIKLTYQFNPLTWHFYAFKITQAFFYVLKVSGPQTAENLMSYIFANQDSFAEEQWMDKTVSQFLDDLANKFSTVTKVPQRDIRNQLQSGTQSFQTARFHWKYTVGSHGVAGAPIFQLNQVRIDGADEFSAADWINFLQKYKSESKTSHIRKHLSFVNDI